MKKILIFTFILTALICCFSLTAFASEAEESKIVSGGALAENEALPTESVTAFEEIYDLVLRHSDKILSALAFVSSLILAFIYRRGVLPLIKGGLQAIGAAVDKLKAETEKASEVSESSIIAAKSKLEETEESMAALTEKLSTLEKELSLLREEAKLCDVKPVLESQTELLYEIFMSSSIPAYLKESVGERVAAMKKQLCAKEVSEND
ncbi:MAG: hypothetical protein E7612_04560 [Ruminococcaceae bacterium]|nr:hypothetical protein [Oscillospiraceae bacterium]